MVDDQIISNLNLQPTDAIVGATPVYGYKVYKIPEISKGKLQVYLMEYGTDGEVINKDTNIIYSTRGFFHVTNKFLQQESKCTIYNLIAKKLDVKLEKILSEDVRRACN
jgi:hypothetical protein